MSKEPNRNVYVGHRYVPKIMGEWDKKQDYEGLSIVTHKGNSYTSKKRVPVGIDILNEEFWVITGNYNAQVDYYRDETERVAQDLLKKADQTYVNTELDKKADQTYVNTELGKKADQTYVNNELDKKADQTYVNTELDKKADQTYVNTELGKKADESYVNTELGKKADVTYVDEIGVNPSNFGVKYDGSDETDALQTVIDYCSNNGLFLLGNNKEIRTTGVDLKNIPGIKGSLNLKAFKDNQKYVVRINDTVNIEKIFVDSDRKSLYGIVASDFGRSHFEHCEVLNSKIWNFKFMAEGNNNMVSFLHERYYYGGQRHTTDFEVIDHYEINSWLNGFIRIKLSNPLPAHALNNEFGKNIYFISINGRAYPVEEVENSNTLKIKSKNLSLGSVHDSTVYIGGGIDIEKYGDNGVGSHVNFDVISNLGIGCQMSSLYGHNFTNPVFQGNGIGFAVHDFSLYSVLIRPYFEINQHDIVIKNYLTGSLINPLVNTEKIEMFQPFFIRGKDDLGRLKILGRESDTFYFGGTKNPEMNPSPHHILAGNYYTYRLTDGADIELTIDNHLNNGRNGHIELNISMPIASKGIINFNVLNTEEKLETNQIEVENNTIIKIYFYNGTWYFTIVKSFGHRNVTNLDTPEYVGQVIVVNKVGYIATGETSNDWKKISVVE